MERINYFDEKQSAVEFLKKFNFEYVVPDLMDNERYCIELTKDLSNVYYCEVERVGSGMIYHRRPFYDRDKMHTPLPNGEITIRFEKEKK